MALARCCSRLHRPLVKPLLPHHKQCWRPQAVAAALPRSFPSLSPPPSHTAFDAHLCCLEAVLQWSVRVAPAHDFEGLRVLGLRDQEPAAGGHCVSRPSAALTARPAHARPLAGRAIQAITLRSDTATA
eukprot:351140-Chlamydomonas_euryale.AAC.8